MSDKEHDGNQREERDMVAPVKPIQPMNVEFDSEKERSDFILWAEGQSKTDPKVLEQIRNRYERFKKLKGNK